MALVAPPTIWRPGRENAPRYESLSFSKLPSSLLRPPCVRRGGSTSQRIIQHTRGRRGRPSAKCDVDLHSKTLHYMFDKDTIRKHTRGTPMRIPA
eukprot:7955603-Pyramimonas_sp.AAC.1